MLNALSDHPQPLAIAASLSPASDPDGDGVVQRSQATVVGQTQPDALLRATTVSEKGTVEAQLTADATGHFQFPTDRSSGFNTLRVEASNGSSASL